MPDDIRDDLAQYYYGKDYAELSDTQKENLDAQLRIPKECEHPAHPDNE